MSAHAPFSLPDVSAASGTLAMPSGSPLLSAGHKRRPGLHETLAAKEV